MTRDCISIKGEPLYFERAHCACSACHDCLRMMWSSERRRVGDAWAHRGEEGRGKLRKARGRGTHPVSPRWPNGGTRPLARAVITPTGVRRTRGTETSQYPEEEESTGSSEPGPAGPRDARSSGERNGRSPNRGLHGPGVVGPADAGREVSRSPLERGARDGESPVGDDDGRSAAVFLSSARPEKSGVKPGGPPSKAKDSCVTDSGRVP